MKADAGYIVETKKGNRGRTKHSDVAVNGKTIVYLEDAEFKPVLNEKGAQMKVLCNFNELKIIGFSD